jgi:hypothetical protein
MQHDLNTGAIESLEPNPTLPWTQETGFLQTDLLPTEDTRGNLYTRAEQTIRTAQTLADEGAQWVQREIKTGKRKGELEWVKLKPTDPGFSNKRTNLAEATPEQLEAEKQTGPQRRMCSQMASAHCVQASCMIWWSKRSMGIG